MTFNRMTAVAAILLTTLGASSAAFAKAHDQGVADGSPNDGTGAFVQSLDQGVSSVVSDGARGEGASANGGDNRIDPVVGNQPD